MDGTLGRTWDAIKLDPEKGLGFDNGLILRNDAGSKYFRPFERIMNENPNNIKRRIYERLMAIKDNVLSPANLASKVDYYKKTDCGIRRIGTRSPTVDRIFYVWIC